MLVLQITNVVQNYLCVLSGFVIYVSLQTYGHIFTSLKYTLVVPFGILTLININLSLLRMLGHWIVNLSLYCVQLYCGKLGVHNMLTGMIYLGMLLCHIRIQYRMVKIQ